MTYRAIKILYIIIILSLYVCVCLYLCAVKYSPANTFLPPPPQTHRCIYYLRIQVDGGFSKLRQLDVANAHHRKDHIPDINENTFESTGQNTQFIKYILTWDYNK